MSWLKKIGGSLLSRNVTTKFNWLLDEFIPPIVRDSLLMYPFLWLVFRSKTRPLMEFKKKAPFLTPDEFRWYYETIGGVSRETDLNDECINFILQNVKGEVVLEVGCGKGYLTRKISEKLQHSTVYAVDIVVTERRDRNTIFIRSSVENLPFEDRMFDTVICTHVLEHVVDLERAVSELRRVAKGRIIIVVPRQREYLYTPDLHVHFFPYEHDLYLKLKLGENARVMKLGGDFLIIEDLQN